MLNITSVYFKSFLFLLLSLELDDIAQFQSSPNLTVIIRFLERSLSTSETSKTVDSHRLIVQFLYKTSNIDYNSVKVLCALIT